MGRFFITSIAYTPGTALTNRLLGFVRGLSESGVKTNVCFFAPDSQCHKITSEFNNVAVRYYWGRHHRTSFGRILSLIKGYSIFLRQLRAGDTVLILGQADLLHFLVKRKDIHVFHECTEHPDVYLPANRFFCISPEVYYSDCAKVEHLFVISQGLKNLFINKGADPNKIDIVNIIVEPSRFDTIRDKASFPKTVSYCGTISNRKDGVDILIRAFAIVVKDHPDAKLYLIGNTPSEKDKVINLSIIDSLGISRNVIFVGAVSPDRMPTLLKESAILALARPDNIQAQFGFPTKLGEYLMTGRPVVLTNVGDISIFLKDKQSAMVVNAGDYEAFAERIIWCMNNPEKAEKIGKEGEKIALKEFNYSSETQKIINYLSI